MKIIFGLVGGLAIFIYGMNMMSECLQKAAGEKMKKIRQGFMDDNVSQTLCDGCLHHKKLPASPLTPEAATINLELFSDKQVRDRLIKAGYLK